MASIVKPGITDIKDIRMVMSYWTETEEVGKYIERIKNEINGIAEYNNLHFWLAKEINKTIGIIGLCDPLEKVIPFAQSNKPGEIKILYVDNNSRGKGIGRELVKFIEEEAKRLGYTELLVRSAERYKDTAYGFYKKMGYKTVGTVSGGDGSKVMQVFQKKLTAKPLLLYHASENRDIAEFIPQKRHVRDPNEGPVIFATPSRAVASIFMVPDDDSWGMSGLQSNVPYKIIGDSDRYRKLDHGGAIYHLPPNTFDMDPNKGLRQYEWTSKVPVKPIGKEIFESGFNAMLEFGVQVYIVDKDIFESIKISKEDHGLKILLGLQSENQKLNKNIQPFIH